MVLAFSAISGAMLHAQGAGTVTGRVTTPTLRPLAGVAVQVQGTSRADMTNESGEFMITSVPAGSQTVEASRLGYTTATARVQVAGGGQARVTLTLSESAVVLEGVTVSPIREGQAKALQVQKNASNIVSVVSADAVGNFPDANVADALKRVSGIGLVRFRGEGVAVNIRGAPPEMSAISINGVNLPSGSTDRDANLNVLSTDIIGALEVNKALTPEMDADAIGGRVNIVTKGALDAGKRRIRITPQIGYYDLGNVRDNTNGSFAYGDVFNVGSNMFGLMISGSRSVVDRDMDNLENTFSGTPTSGFRPSGFTVKAYDITRTRESLTARLDYAIGDATHFFFSASDAKLENAEFRNTASIHWPTFANSTTGVISNSGAATFRPGSDIHQGVNTSTTSRYNFHDRLTVTDTWSLSGGGRHTLGRISFDYTGSMSRQAAEEPPGRKYIAYRAATGTAPLTTTRYDFSNPSFPRFTRLDRATDQPVDGLMQPDLSLYNFYEYNERYDLTDDDTRSFVTNARLPFAIAGHDATFQIGAKYNSRAKDKVRTFVQALQGTTPAEPSPPRLTDLLGGRTMNNFGRYNLGSAFRTPAVHDNAEKVQNERKIPASEAPNDYEVDEDIAAVYGMSTLDIGGLRLLAGLRAEQTKLVGTGKVSTDGWKTITEKTNERTFNHVFPSLHARYMLPTGTIVRAAFTSGINRPKFTNIRPSGNLIENETLSTFTGSNPDIKPTTALSYDLMAEHYFPVGVISGGVFAKQLRNVVFRTIRDGTAEDFFVGQSLEGFRITRDENGRDGIIKGAEVNLDRSFDFLPGFLSGLGVMTNYTYTFSEADVPGPGGGRSTLANQPSKVVNVSGYYEAHGLSLRLTYNWQNDYVESIGEQAWQSLHVAPRGIYDLTTSFKINRNASLFVEGSNLDNSLQEKYYGKYSEGRIFEVEQFGRQFWTGLRLNF